MSASGWTHWKIRWKKTEVVVCNSALSTAAAFDDRLSATFSWALPTVLAGVDVCIQIMENDLKAVPGQKVVRMSRAQVWMNIVKVMGPTLGLPDSEFMKLAAAMAVMGVSLAGFVTVAAPVAAGGLTAAAGVEITLAAMGLFFDAVAFAAAERGVRGKYEPMVRQRFEQALRLNLANRYGLERRLPGSNRNLWY